MPFLSTEHLAEDVSLGLWLLNEEEDFFFKNYPCLHDLQDKMTTIGSKQRRLEKLAARALLFEMTNRADLYFNHNDSGKPLVEGYHVSVSHTKGMVAFLPLSSISTPQVRSYFQLLACTVSLIYLCPYTAIGVIKYIVRWTKKSKIKKPFW